MGSRLVPITLAELCVHALELEQDLAARYGEYAPLARSFGTHAVADAFREMQRLEEQESKALKAGVHGNKLPELSPWEHLWRLTYAPDSVESGKRMQPRTAREALQLALEAEQRAESFYHDTAATARDSMVRACAAEMATVKCERLQLLEHLLARESRTDWFRRRPRENAGRRTG